MTDLLRQRSRIGLPVRGLPGTVLAAAVGRATLPAVSAVASAPSFWSDRCAARRAGIAGCSACAQVCPHQALHMASAGPQIDADACRRCGACTAACPVGALERSFLPDAELFDRVAAAASGHPGLLVLCCDHEASQAGEIADSADSAEKRTRLALPCVQIVSDELLVSALVHGAGAVVVAPDPACPNAPHVQPERAVSTARATLEARGWDPSRVALVGSESEWAVETEHASRSGPPVSIPLGGERFERRMTLLDALGSPAQSPSASPPTELVPWRRMVVDESKCTGCGACAFVCPTGALALGEGGTALYGREAACIGCGLCASACPESALSLVPTVPIDGDARLLARPEVARCHGCGGRLLAESLVAAIESRLAHREAASAASRAALRLCEHCKGARLFEPAPLATAPPAAGAYGAAEGNPALRASAGDERSATSSVDDNLSRRSFLQLASSAAVGAVALAGAAAAADPEPPRHRYGMVIDTRRCVGCKACVVACKAENKTPPGVNYILVTNNTLGERPDDKPLFTAKPCFHCEHPPCVDVCPVSATFKRKQDGIVVVDYDRCIGCRYCQTACPYGARFFDYGENYAAETGDGPYRPPSPEYGQFRPRTKDASPIGNVRKCTFCMHLQDENGEYDKQAGRWPACAKTCTGHAIHFGDFQDSASDVSRLVRERQPVRLEDELGAEPNVEYLL